jgi:hypothetical protein
MELIFVLGLLWVLGSTQEVLNSGSSRALLEYLGGYLVRYLYGYLLGEPSFNGRLHGLQHPRHQPRGEVIQLYG